MRLSFKILLKICHEMPDFLQWLIDISGQSTSIDCTMSILTFVKCKLSAVHLKVKKVGLLGYFGTVLGKCHVIL